MIKNKFNKFSLLFILMIFLFNIYFPITSNAKVTGNTSKIDSKTIFSSEYSFTPKFIKNITTTQSSGMTNYSADYSCPGSDSLNPNTYYTARLTSKSQKGKIWVRYNNVGTYNGQIIDLKITLIGWNYLQPANTSASLELGGVNYPTAIFSKNSISIGVSSIPAIDSPNWAFTFYINNTNNIIPMKSHITFKDLDGSTTGGNEKIIFNSGIEHAYISQNSMLTINSNECVNSTTQSTSSADSDAWVTCLNNNSVINFTYTRDKDIQGNTFRNITKTASSESRVFYSYSVGSESVAPFEFTVPKKNCNTSQLRGLEEATYTISQFIPGESSNFYYNSYCLMDEIPDCFDIVNVFVTDDSKQNRNSWFTTLINNNLVTITANSSILKNTNFYNNNFYFNIIVAKKSDNFISSWFNNQNYFEALNTAKIEINAPSLSGIREKTLFTNTVNTNIQKEFILPKTGANGDFIYTSIGIILISIYFIYKRRL